MSSSLLHLLTSGLKTVFIHFHVARCEVPEPPGHGSLVTSGDNTVGSTISLACSDGFILMGETIIR